MDDEIVAFVRQPECLMTLIKARMRTCPFSLLQKLNVLFMGIMYCGGQKYCKSSNLKMFAS